jgi:hypothetical protein
VGQDVEVIDSDDHAFCDGVLNRIVHHKTCDDKDVHPCVITREDGQLGTITLVDHNSTNRQTNGYPKLLEDTQFQLSLAFSKLDNFMKSKPHLKFNKLDVRMCFASQGLDYITNVDWPTKNLNTQLALVVKSIFANYTSSSEMHVLAINDVYK